MKKCILSMILTFAIALSFVTIGIPMTATTDSTDSIFPYDLGAPYFTDYHPKDGSVIQYRGQTWNPSNAIIASADILVVEFEDGGNFLQFAVQCCHNNWESKHFLSWDNNGEGRITVEPGKAIFDFRGLARTRISFGANNLQLTSGKFKVTNAYLDVLPPPNPDDLSLKAIYVDANAENAGNGTKANPYRSLSDACDNANPGDVIIVADGVYRGVFSPPSGIAERPTILKAAEGAKPRITSAMPFDGNWSVHEGNIYVADVDNATAARMAEFPQLFVDGVSMIEARYPNLPGSDMRSIMEQVRATAQLGTDSDTIVAPDDIPQNIWICHTIFQYPLIYAARNS